MRAALALLAGAALTWSAVPAVAAANEQGPESVSEASAPAPSTDRVIVRWAPGSSGAERAAARADAGVEDAQSLGKRFAVLGLPDDVDADAALAALEKDPAVAAAEFDSYATVQNTTPNDPLFDQLWGLDNQGLNINGVASSTPGVDIDALKAWAKTTGDASVVVADLDDGIRPNHPDLKNRIWRNADEVPSDGLDNDSNGYIDDTFGMDFAGPDVGLPALLVDNDPTDDVTQGGHGTHTAGTIAAQGNNGEGVTGVAPNTTLMPLRVCGLRVADQAAGLCPVSAQIAAINYAGANGARIANMSLGGVSVSTLQRDAFAVNPNVLFVVAAGNNGQDNEVTGQSVNPCSADPTTSGKPGAVDNVVCVAASDQNDAKASFSNWGRTKVDLAAPGTEILSTYPWEIPFVEDFETDGWPYAGWSDGGWQRSDAAPLTDWGITSTTAPAQADLTTRTVTTPLVSIDGPRTCKFVMKRQIVRSAADAASYRIFVDGGQVALVNPSTSGTISSPMFSVPAGTRDVNASFSYTRNGGVDTNGFSLSRLDLQCNVPPGLETSALYGFLNGTSMATPHVTGAAALLAAYEPSATTMQLKQALLSSVDPVADFHPVTGTHPVTSGGRLNADKALDAVDAFYPPETELASGPSGTVVESSATFEFRSPSKTVVTFECSVDAAGFAPCTSPFTTGALANGGHTFAVRARDGAGNADPTAASATWTVDVPQQQVLSAPTKVTGVKVKRKKTKAIIRWAAVPGATSYKVTVGKTSKTTTKPSFTVKKLKPKSKVKVKIAAVNGAGSSPVVTVKVRRAKA